MSDCLSESVVYEFYLDSWKYSYKGLWSTIPLAIENLPKCPRFLRTVGWNLGGWQSSEKNDLQYVFDRDHNVAQVPELVIVDTCTFAVYINNFKTNIYRNIVIKEVKKPGEPYQPGSTSRESVDSVFERKLICTGYISEIKLDYVGLDYND